MAEGSQRTRLRGETRGVICGVHYAKFRNLEVRVGGKGTASNELVLARSPEHYFKFARERLFQTLIVGDNCISADQKVRSFL